jgi:alpha-amylase
MDIGKRHAGRKYVDWLNKYPGTVTIDQEGKGEFHVGGRQVSVWVQEGA